MKNDSKVFGREQLYELVTSVESEKDDSRDVLYYVKVLQYLLKEEFATTGFGDDAVKELQKKIRLDMDKSEPLFAYTAFLSHQPQFNHTWSYLREQIQCLVNQLVKIELFIDSMLNNVNEFMAYDLDSEYDVSLNFEGLFTYSFPQESSIPHTIIHWENLSRLFSLGNGFYVLLGLKGSTIYTIKRGFWEKLSFPEQIRSIILKTRK